MEIRRKDWIDSLTFEINAEQVATLNRILPSHKFRFVPYDEGMKNVRIKRTGSSNEFSKYEASPNRGGKTHYGLKHPGGSLKDSSFNDYSLPGPNSNAASVNENMSSPMQPCFDLLSTLKEIVTKDFQSIKHKFDFEILERGINNGYYINLEEFKVAARQVIRALASKHKEMNFQCKCYLSPINYIGTSPLTTLLPHHIC